MFALLLLLTACPSTRYPAPVETSAVPLAEGRTFVLERAPEGHRYPRFTLDARPVELWCTIESPRRWEDAELGRLGRFLQRVASQSVDHPDHDLGSVSHDDGCTVVAQTRGGSLYLRLEVESWACGERRGLMRTRCPVVSREAQVTPTEAASIAHTLLEAAGVR